jgi:hypothetical protein
LFACGLEEALSSMAAGRLNRSIQAKSKEFFDASNSSHRHITQFALQIRKQY